MKYFFYIEMKKNCTNFVGLLLMHVFIMACAFVRRKKKKQSRGAKAFMNDIEFLYLQVDLFMFHLQHQTFQHILRFLFNLRKKLQHLIKTNI